VTSQLNGWRNDQWGTSVIEIVDVKLKSYFQTPAREHMLTNPEEVEEAIRCLKVGKAHGPNGIPNRTLKHLPMRSVLLLVHIYNAILSTDQFPQFGSTLE
jgi:hypothetical protein